MNMETVADWQVLHHVLWRQIIWYYAPSALLLLLLLLLLLFCNMRKALNTFGPYLNRNMPSCI